MQKIITTITIIGLALVIFLSVSLVLSQNSSKIENPTAYQEAKGMKNLTIKNDLKMHGIEVVAPTDANFNAELQQYIGNYNEAIPLVEAAKPFVLFIKNYSSKEVVGIALRWEFVKSNGKIQKINQIETSPGVLMGMKPYDPFMVGKTSLINSNSHRFMSYFYGIAQQLLNAFKSNSYKRFEYKLGPEKARDYISDTEYQKQMILTDVTSVSVAIDAIIFNDGTFVGENQSFLFEIMSGLVQARRDFIKKLREAKQSGKSDTDSLNKFVSDMKSVSTDRLPTSNFLDDKDAFEQTYKYQLGSYIEEIKRKRSNSTDDYILKDFLVVRDSDFIDLRRK